MRRLLDHQGRAGSLFGAHSGSVKVREGADPIAPALDVQPDAETGREIDRCLPRSCSTRTSPFDSIPATTDFDPRARPDRRVLAKRGTIYLSAVTAWEIALLVDIGRIELDLPVEEWITRFVQGPGIIPAPLSHHAASRSCRLHHLEHRDPADRVLIATAIELASPLVTYDDRILRFARRHGGQYGFAARD
jgi:PIN domain nuclease of toxin-antitoxin system